jgi:membrane fusion protein (multidrug efflux system)
MLAMQVKNRRRLMVILCATIVGLVMAFCTKATLLAEKKQGGEGGVGGPQEVAVIKIAPQKVTLTTELPGRTSAYLVAEVRPQVNGIIQKRKFTEGANVKELMGFNEACCCLR